MRGLLRRYVAAYRHRDRDQHRIDRPAGPANPYEAWVFSVCIVSGVATLSRLARPAALEQAAPAGFRVFWAVLLTVGAAAALTGLYWPGNPFTGLFIKRAGIIAMAGALLVYGLVLLALGQSGVVVALTTLGLAGASVARAVQITRALAATRGKLRELAEPGEEP